ncbi:hypothetical protein ACP70R_045462 [Stipagrostis hirtigluma subsp. patula]
MAATPPDYPDTDDSDNLFSDDSDSYFNSVADLMEKLGIDGDPDAFFDRATEVPQWIYGCEENEISPYDPAIVGEGSLPDPNNFPAPTEKSNWAKVSTLEGISATCSGIVGEEARVELFELPLYLFLLPSIPLRDVYELSVMRRFPQVKDPFHIYNDGLFQSKLSAFNRASKLVADITTTGKNLEIQARALSAQTEPKVERAQAMKKLYMEARAAYQEAKKKELPSGRVQEELFNMLAAASRLHAAQQAVKTMEEAATSMASLAESMAKKAADLEDALRRPTFMGCPVLQPGGGDAQGGGGWN